jgi:hypothetical protein
LIDPTVTAEFAATSTQLGQRAQSFVSYPSNVLAYDLNRPIGHTTLPRSHGSWKLKAISTQPPPTSSTSPAGALPKVTDTTVYVTFEVTEPLLLSPFVFGSGHGK